MRDHSSFPIPKGYIMMNNISSDPIKIILDDLTIRIFHEEERRYEFRISSSHTDQIIFGTMIGDSSQEILDRISDFISIHPDNRKMISDL